MKTTLNQIRAQSPCKDGWEKLLRSIGKTTADDDVVTIAQIIDSNGLDDALWCLRAVQGHDKEIRLYAVWCARQAQHLMTDQRSIAALDVSDRFARGNASADELAAAQDAAQAAAQDAARAAARAAAQDAAQAAARAAAWAAARDDAESAQEKRLRDLCAECAEASA